jgi:hypothetical protein
MAKAINNAVIKGYLRRGLIDVRFNEAEGATIERRLLLDAGRVVFVVPWRIVEDVTQWEPSKEQCKEAAAALYSIRANKARQMRARRVSSSDV